jgi:hypothetical protein
MEHFESTMFGLNTKVYFSHETGSFAAPQREGTALLPNIGKNVVFYRFMLQACDPLATACPLIGATQ